MIRALGLWRRLYGATPLHLIGHLVAFAIALFALHRILVGGHEINFLAWFLAAAILHDLLLLPAYSLIDRAAARSVGRRMSRPPTREVESSTAHSRRLEVESPTTHSTVPVINHLRAPALISGVLLLVYAPEIFGLGDRPYYNATGHHLEGYVRNWLLISVALFLGSALIYAVRRRRPAPA
jgi:hypothetical protein